MKDASGDYTSAALDSPNRAVNLDELFSSTIHDLRTPLVCVLGYAKLMLKEQAGGINSTQREYLQIIRANAAKAIEHLNHASLSAAETGPRLQCFDLRELCLETMELIRPRASRRSIELIALLCGEPCRVAADHEKLALVFHKLLTNAVRLTSPENRIEVALIRGEEGPTVRIANCTDRLPPDFQLKVLGCSPGPDKEASDIASDIHDIISLYGGRAFIENGTTCGWALIVTFPAAPSNSDSGVKQT